VALSVFCTLERELREATSFERCYELLQEIQESKEFRILTKEQFFLQAYRFQVSTETLKDIESSFHRGLDSTAALQELISFKKASGNRTPSNLKVISYQTNPLPLKPVNASKPSPVLSALLKRKSKHLANDTKAKEMH